MSFLVMAKIAFIVFSLISGLIYLFRRMADKSRRKTFLSEAPVVRSITDVEREALVPFLEDNFGLPLISDEVRVLKGDFTRHGVHFNNNGNSGSQMHNTMGGVDVLLPYDALAYIRADGEGDNSAEVVMTASYAIVIKLNDGFDLIGGRDRALTASYEASGDSKPADGKPWMKVLSERSETATEMRARASAGSIVTGIVMLLGLCMLAFGSKHEMVFAAACLLIAGAIWRIFFYQKHIQPRSIRQVEGVVMTVQHAAASSHTSTQLMNQTMSIGGQQSVIIPPSWLGYVKMGEQAVVDVCPDDRSVLRYGPVLNVQEEEELFPQKPVWRYLWFVAVAGICLAFVWLLSDGLNSDVTRARIYVQHMMGGGQSLSNPDIAEVGDIVTVEGVAHCDLIDKGGEGYRCNALRLGKPDLTKDSDEQISADIDPIDPELVNLYNKKFVDSAYSSLASILNRVNRAATGVFDDDPIVSMSYLYEQINTRCLAAAGLSKSKCDAAQAVIVDSFIENGHPEMTWEKLGKMIAVGEFGNITLDLPTKLAWERAIAGLATAFIEGLVDEKVAKLRANQKPGVVYRFPDDWVDSAIENRVLTGDSRTGRERMYDWPRDVFSSEAYMNRSDNDLTKRIALLDEWHRHHVQVKVQGVVTATKQNNAHGDTVLHIDPALINDNELFSAAQRVASLLIAVALLVISLIVFALRLIASRKRDKLLLEHWSNRIANSRWAR